MLTRVEISNYRGFRSYRMEDLARVNLLVGKNNSGKTALLEGLQFLTSGGEPDALVEAAMRRGEVILRGDEPAGRPGVFPRIDIAHFFHGHSLNLDVPFSLGGDNGFPPVQVKLVVIDDRARQAGGEAPDLERRSYALKIDGGISRDPNERLFRVAHDGGAELETGPRFRRPRLPRRAEGAPVRFVGAESLELAVLASFWDEVVQSGREAEVAESLRIIDAQIRSVHFLTGVFASGYYPSRAGVLVGVDADPSRVPLGSLGDGMRRLLAMSTSLVVSTRGFVFIDEIDTGLHYSVMADVWKLVVETALRYDIQVFATTHSWDCVDGLRMLCKRDPELMEHVGVHKIDRGLDHSVAFQGERFVRAVEGGIELR